MSERVRQLFKVSWLDVFSMMWQGSFGKPGSGPMLTEESAAVQVVQNRLLGAPWIVVESEVLKTPGREIMDRSGLPARTALMLAPAFVVKVTLERGP